MRKIQSAEDQRERTRQERAAAVAWLLAHEREERYLISFRYELQEYEKSFTWLSSDDARNHQKYYDFLLCFESMREKMREFRWSKDFLAANGIDFERVRKMYFSLIK